ncbi:DUF4215 domain-containing protein [Polyangium jinanense]|uniref:DUF4215 domain-containing protein n=1 Tax=Polyangium jinanense TaxID=2829994 RepID=UPI00233F9AD9|nr:DUF4215 domain-containing protein [Polyangium jinanense]
MHRSFFHRRMHTLAVTLSLLVSGCSSNDVEPPPDPDIDQPVPDGGTCELEGTFTVSSIEVIEGACDLEIADATMAVRRVGETYLLDFDDTNWDSAARQPGCKASFQGPDAWYYNNTFRTRSLALEVSGDNLTAEIKDALDGADSEGHTCDATIRVHATRTGPAPAGAPLGDSCGPVGCSGTRCAFGSQFECASGVCLLDTDPFLQTMCTEPCTPQAGCPDGFMCLWADEGWDGAAEGYYCAPWRAVCGNGIVDDGEACDDGNQVDGDGCSADCSSDESCGNGMLEQGEVCEAEAPGEWLTCTAACTLDAPAGLSMPLPIDAFGITAASNGTGRFLVGGTVNRFAQNMAYQAYVARTVDGGATWTDTIVAPDVMAFAQLGAIAADGARVAVGLVGGFEATGFWLAESTDGGATFPLATFQTLPEGNAHGVEVEDNGTLELMYAPDGSLLALVAIPDGVLVSRREPGTMTWKTTGSLHLSQPGASDCTFRWRSPRLEAIYATGVHLHHEGSHLQVTAGQRCVVNGKLTQIAGTIESTDGGASFGPAVDLVAASGLSVASSVLVSPGPRGPLGVCITGTDASDAVSARCAVAPAPGGAWSFHDTGATFMTSTSNEPSAVEVLAPDTLLLTQTSSSTGAVVIHRGESGGSTWSQVELSQAHASLGGRSLQSISTDALWLFEVDGNNDASLVRLTMGGSVAAPRTWLFGDARRLDGSGPPWQFASAEDSAGALLIVYSVPDDLRDWVTVAQVLK